MFLCQPRNILQLIVDPGYKRTYLVVNELLFGIILLQQGEEIDDIGILRISERLVISAKINVQTSSSN